MKRILFIAVLALVCSIGSFAQQKQTVVGKWKLISLTSDGTTFNIDNPEEMKKELQKQFEASGTPADSAMVNTVFESLMASLGNMTFDFGADGKLVISVTKEEKEEENYTVDYDKGTIISKSTTSSKQQNLNFRFDKENMIIQVNEGGKLTEMVLKRIK